MADYTSVANVYALYPRIGSMTSITSSNISFYIDQAENEMNGYLANNYSLPFATDVPIVTTIATEFSVVKILERFFTQEIGSKNEWVEERYKHVYETLTQISSGDLSLVTSSYEVLAYFSNGGIYSNNQNNNPVFNRLNTTLQEFDGDQLRDEYDTVRDTPRESSLE
tara:strand:- start:24214 stop:24714 length:501 start_codon:yes stop_codon:yes gene_type:complete